MTQKNKIKEKIAYIKANKNHIKTQDGTKRKEILDLILKDVSLKEKDKWYIYSFARTIKNKNQKPQKTITKTEKPNFKNSDLKKYIPTKNNYIPRNIYGTTDVKLLTLLYKNRNNTEIVKKYPLIIGETGCGKTHLLRNLAYREKIPYIRVNLNGASTVEDLVGQWLPNPESNGAKYIWIDGWLPKLMKNGGFLVIDEINMAEADILAILNSVTDDEQRLILTQKNGEIITAHKDFWIGFTMNPEYEGTKPLNQALKDRLKVITHNYSTKVEAKLGINKKIITIAEQLRASKEIYTPVSTRDLIDYNGNIKIFGEPISRAFFINNFNDVTEQKVVEEVFKLVIDGKKPEKEVEDNNGGGI